MNIGRCTPNGPSALIILLFVFVGFKYDAFIVFSSHDSAFVDNTLVPLIEEDFKLTCCIHHRDFILGVPFVQNMANSVSQSRKIIAVVSKHFFESNNCDFELQMALQRLLEWRDDSVLVIKVDNLDKRKLPVELQRRSYIDYNNLIERVSWKDRLNKYLDVQTTTTTTTTNVGETNNVDETNNNHHQPTTNTVHSF